MARVDTWPPRWHKSPRKLSPPRSTPEWHTSPPPGGRRGTMVTLCAASVAWRAWRGEHSELARPGCRACGSQGRGCVARQRRGCVARHCSAAVSTRATEQLLPPPGGLPTRRTVQRSAATMRARRCRHARRARSARARDAARALRQPTPAKYFVRRSSATRLVCLHPHP